MKRCGSTIMASGSGENWNTSAPAFDPSPPIHGVTNSSMAICDLRIQKRGIFGIGRTAFAPHEGVGDGGERFHDEAEMLGYLRCVRAYSANESVA